MGVRESRWLLSLHLVGRGLYLRLLSTLGKDPLWLPPSPPQGGRRIEPHLCGHPSSKIRVLAGEASGIVAIVIPVTFGNRVNRQHDEDIGRAEGTVDDGAFADHRAEA